MKLTITAALPTRNRPDDLAAAVDSILTQQRLPNELIIVDQSPSDESKRRIEAKFGSASAIKLTYVHDPMIAGLVAAKQVAARLSNTDVLCFLEDDVVLEPSYLAELEDGFLQQADMLGCCGVVVNLPPLPPLYSSMFHLFHLGIFHDPRVGVHGHYEGSGHSLIQSRALSGGLSAWRKEVLDVIPFDVANEFFMLEDIDYSTRAEAQFGSRFYINPNARLIHNMSPLNRARLGDRQRRKLREYLLFYKKRSAIPGAFLNLMWLIPGLFLEMLLQAITHRSFAPLMGFFAGIRDGARRKIVGSM